MLTYPYADKLVVLVAGSGRCGTSMLSEVLVKHGFDPGDDLVKSNAYNRRGYFEYLPIVDFHKRVLEKRNLSRLSGSALPLPEDWFEYIQQYYEELAAILSARFSKGGGSLFLFKDPRSSYMLPLWESVCSRLGCKLVIIAPFRNPESAVKSICLSGKCTAHVAESVYFQRNCMSVMMARKFHLFDYDASLRDCTAEFSKLFSKFGIAYDASLIDFVDSGKSEPAPKGNVLRPPTYRLYRVMQATNRYSLPVFLLRFVVSRMYMRWRLDELLQKSK